MSENNGRIPNPFTTVTATLNYEDLPDWLNDFLEGRPNRTVELTRPVEVPIRSRPVDFLLQSYGKRESRSSNLMRQAAIQLLQMLVSGGTLNGSKKWDQLVEDLVVLIRDLPGDHHRQNREVYVELARLLQSQDNGRQLADSFALVLYRLDFLQERQVLLESWS